MRGELFDVTMSAYNEAELWELVGIFLLNKVTSLCRENNIGIYRQDGLTIFKSKNGFLKVMLEFLSRSYYRTQFKNGKLFRGHFRSKRWTKLPLP